MSERPVIVLTGGPGGGKTTLIRSLLRDPRWADHLITLPEAIQLVGGMGVSPQAQRFQGLMVQMQMVIEDGIRAALPPEDPRALICHRGTLDPLAYWLDRGWPEAEFFTLTNTTRQMHNARYTAVIHLVTAADGAPAHYKRWPQAHRPEQPEDAIRLDRLLTRVWGSHPRYIHIDNQGRDWQTKEAQARAALRQLLGKGFPSSHNG